MIPQQNQSGISVIICCYNSAKRLNETLASLAAQIVVDLEWEIILVDNNSTDDTVSKAKAIWKTLDKPFDLRIISEKEQGLGYARRRGINEANYSYLVFCDDDNWLSPEYVQLVYSILEKDENIAACGGIGLPVFEVKKPYWFDEYREAYALGPQWMNEENGRILNLYGAGMGIRKDLIDNLHNSDFKPILQGRTMTSLSSSDDTELTYALAMMGYKLEYSPKLVFHHYLPKERLTLSYLQRLFVAFGSDGPIRNLYYSALTNRFFHRQIRNWSFHLLLSITRLVKYAVVPPKKYGRKIYLNWNIAYIRNLIAIRGSYKKIKRTIFRISDSSNKFRPGLTN